jgi:peptidoglycan/xylan/chitin deacetylase (PgdA/CDA1 family)
VWLGRDLSATLYSGNVVLVRVGETSRGAVTRIITPSRVVALSIDDGPDPRFTPAVLATLRRHQAHATFVLGTSALAHPDLVRREVRGGHRVANHTLDHPHLHRLGDAARGRSWAP